eukprot:jgi/Mesvir1/17179/Mv07600-RA.1
MGDSLELLQPTATSPGMRYFQFSKEASDAILHFQILEMQAQVYVWVGTKPRMSDLCAAIKTRMADTPAVTQLLPFGISTEGHGAVMAQRLAKKLGRPVLVSSNLPPDVASLQPFAEKTVIDALRRIAATDAAAPT